MHRDNRDFAGHPPRRHLLTPSTVLAATFIVSLIGAAVWAESRIASEFYAGQEADKQMGSTRP